MTEPTNAEVAEYLTEAARRLFAQGASRYRVQAYQRAAELLTALEAPVAELVRSGGEAVLRQLPGIGPTLARAITEVVTSGALTVTDELRQKRDPIALLSSVPGIGERTAERLHRELGIDSLEALEQAAESEQLAALGLGSRVVQKIRDGVADALGRVHRTDPLSVEDSAMTAGPPIAELLAVDREYRDKAAAGTLHRIAPRRNNPGHEAWLPVMHVHRGGRQYTALFSNTAHAHERDRISDWVVLYFHEDGTARDSEQQCTVITARRGALAGQRVVRGREAECERYYRKGSSP